MPVLMEQCLVFTPLQVEIYIFFLLNHLLDIIKNHPLSERLTTLVVIASIFFLSQYTDSRGVYIVEPHKELISL